MKILGCTIRISFLFFPILIFLYFYLLDPIANFLEVFIGSSLFFAIEFAIWISGIKFFLKYRSFHEFPTPANAILGIFITKIIWIFALTILYVGFKSEYLLPNDYFLIFIYLILPSFFAIIIFYLFFNKYKTLQCTKPINIVTTSILAGVSFYILLNFIVLLKVNILDSSYSKIFTDIKYNLENQNYKALDFNIKFIANHNRMLQKTLTKINLESSSSIYTTRIIREPILTGYGYFTQHIVELFFSDCIAHKSFLKTNISNKCVIDKINLLIKYTNNNKYQTRIVEMLRNLLIQNKNQNVNNVAEILYIIALAANNNELISDKDYQKYLSESLFATLYNYKDILVSNSITERKIFIDYPYRKRLCHLYTDNKIHTNYCVNEIVPSLSK